MSLHPRYPWAALLGALCVATVGCSSDSTTSGSAAIALSLVPASGTAVQGGSVSVNGTIIRTAFTGDIGITVTGVPTGVTASVISAPVGGGTTATVLLSVASTVSAGNYTLHVTASGTGVTSAQADFALTVTAGTGGGLGGIHATLDGQAWTSSAFQNASYANNVANLSGWNGTDYITITVSGATGAGTTSLDYSNATGSTVIVTNGVGGSWSTGVRYSTGTITFTTLTANHMVGTFSFTAYQSAGGGPAIRVATNGTFDLTF